MDTNGHTSLYEDYVSFETAKLLKEKGYNGPSVFYDEEDAYRWNSENFIEVSNPNYDSSIPFDTETFRECLPHITLAMAMKWLRKTHQIFIRISTDFLYPLKYYGEIFCYGDNLKTQQDVTTETFESPEEAAEAAIRYCLENLI